MKKYCTILIILFCGKLYAQTDTIPSNRGVLKYYTNYALPNTTLKYWTGYGTFGSFLDTARSAISSTGSGGSYNPSTGVITFSSSGWSLTGNAIADSTTSFLGTTTDWPLIIRNNSIRSGQISDSLVGNTAFGYGALRRSVLRSATALSSTFGGENSAFGNKALSQLTSGYLNTAIGSQSLNFLTTGHHNVGLGSQTLTLLTTGVNNIAIGAQALDISNASGNTAIGTLSMRNASGSYNTAIGDQALPALTSGQYNTSIGTNSSQILTTGSNNTAIGMQALGNTINGGTNTAIGYQAMFYNAAGSGNVAIGPLAAWASDGNYNVAIGNYAGVYALGGTFPNGPYAHISRSIMIGDSTRALTTTSENEIVIGVNVTGLGSNTTVLGDSATTLAKIYGANILDGNGDTLSTKSYARSVGGGGGGSYLPLAGGTMVGNILATDNLYDLGASGATRFRTAYLGTSLFSPLIIGGTSTTQTLTYKTTTGVGTTGADHIFQVGNNGGTEALRILNSGDIYMRADRQLGLGTTTFAAWDGGINTIQGPTKVSSFAVDADDAQFSVNSYYAGGWKYVKTAAAATYAQSTVGDHRWRTAASGSAGAAITWVNAMYLDVAGRLGLGTVSPTAVIHLKAGTATASTAPLKFTSGTNLTTPEAGAVEFDGTNYFATSSTTRYTLAKTLTATATLDFGSTLAGTVTDLTITVTGAADGDVVDVGVPNGSYPATGTFSAWVSAANTVTVRYANNSLTLTQDPASGTFRAAVIKY